MTRKRAEEISSGLTVLSVFFGCGLLFSNLIPFDWIGKIFGLFSVLMFLISLALLLLYPDIFVLESKKELVKHGLDRQYVSMYNPIFVPGALATVDLLFGVNVSNWWELVIASIVVVLVLGLLFWKFLPYLRENLLELVAAALLVGMMQMGLIWQVNTLLDFVEPVYIQVEVRDIGKSNHRKGPDTYYFVADLNGEERRIEVSIQQWKELSIGEDVTIAIHSGGLGMEYFVLADAE